MLMLGREYIDVCIEMDRWKKENVDSSISLFNRYNEHPIVRARGCATWGGTKGFILDALLEEWAVYLRSTLFHLKFWQKKIITE